MAQQTAVDWLIDRLVEEEFLYIDDKPNHMIPLGNLINQAKEMEFRQHGLFLHWVIKHYSTETIDGMFAWVDSMGKEVTVREIVEHYYKETYKPE
jgi:hypothetical protein